MLSFVHAEREQKLHLQKLAVIDLLAHVLDLSFERKFVFGAQSRHVQAQSARSDFLFQFRKIVRSRVRSCERLPGSTGEQSSELVAGGLDTVQCDIIAPVFLVAGPRAVETADGPVYSGL